MVEIYSAKSLLVMMVSNFFSNGEVGRGKKDRRRKREKKQEIAITYERHTYLH